MGLFDFLKKKPDIADAKPIPTPPQNTETYIKKETVSVPKSEPQVYTLEIATVTVQTFESHTEYAYNEVLAYARFFDRYKVVKTPKYMHECDYPRWQFMTAGVNDIHKLHIELFEKGFYKIASVEEILSIYKVAEIKAVASSLNITASGKKDALIAGIASAATVESVLEILKTEVYSLSQKALDYLSEHEIEIEYYNRDNNDMSLEEYISKRKRISKDDMEWADLERDLKKDKDGFGRNPYFAMAGFYEGKGDTQNALLSYLRVLYIDLSGAENYRAWCIASGNEEQRKKYRMDCLVSIVIAPGLIKRIKALLPQNFTPSMIDTVYEKKLPIQACSQIMFGEIIALIQKDALTSENTSKIEKALNNNLKILARDFK